jgi:DNA-binding NtrC family response regulator
MDCGSNAYGACVEVSRRDRSHIDHERRQESVQVSSDELPLGEILATGYLEFKRQRVLEFERRLLGELLKYFNGNKSAMSKAVKMDRANLGRLLKKHGLVRGNNAPDIDETAEQITIK